jgi:tetratricopeptide (TPR) repeat protein
VAAGLGDLAELVIQRLDRRRRFDDWLATITVSLDVSRRLGDDRHEGIALTILGYALRQVRWLVEAITALRDAVAIHRRTGDCPREGTVLNNLDIALLGAQRYDEAIIAFQDAAAIFRLNGDQEGERIALEGLETGCAAPPWASCPR